MVEENNKINELPSNQINVQELTILYTQTFQKQRNKIQKQYEVEKGLNIDTNIKWFNREYGNKLWHDRENLIEQNTPKVKNMNLFKSDLVDKFKLYSNDKYKANPIENFIRNDIPAIITEHQAKIKSNNSPQDYLWDVEFVLHPDYRKIIELLATYNAYIEVEKNIDPSDPIVLIKNPPSQPTAAVAALYLCLLNEAGCIDGVNKGARGKTEKVKELLKEHKWTLSHKNVANLMSKVRSSDDDDDIMTKRNLGLVIKLLKNEPKALRIANKELEYR